MLIFYLRDIKNNKLTTSGLYEKGTLSPNEKFKKKKIRAASVRLETGEQ